MEQRPWQNAQGRPVRLSAPARRRSIRVRCLVTATASGLIGFGLVGCGSGSTGATPITMSPVTVLDELQDDSAGAASVPTQPVDAGASTTTATTATTTASSPAAETAPVETTPGQPVPTVPVLPIPVPPPADENGIEPVVELGSIEIPKLDLAASMFEGILLSTFDRGPGHWPGTAMPGQFGNAVIGGHRTSSSRPFRYLDQLTPGDEVIFTTADGRFVYKVVSTEIVTPDVLRVTYQNPGFTATLFACHPVGSTKERIIVHLTLASS